ncbi:HV01 protein, partial [Scytalopus superciliaris]|nr:HV01 protein [Scytalopus superciliaris]
LRAQRRLEETGGKLRAPGQSVRLSCRGSGFSFGDYLLWWYHQSPRDSFEWVSFSNLSGRGQHNRAAVQDRATASRDNSRSEVSLSLRALQPRVSARYFCAVHTG